MLREWTAQATGENARRYVRFFARVLRPRLEARPGFLGESVSTYGSDEVTTIDVTTRWASMDAVRGFAPDDRAVIEEEARALLSSFDERAVHHQVWEWRVEETFDPRYDATTTETGLEYGCEIKGPFCGYDGQGAQTWQEFLDAGPPAKIRMPGDIAASIRAYALARKI